jgi:hypothetical protein
MDHARRHRSPPRPRAYEVWYTYAVGLDPVLRARVDSELVKTGVVNIDTIELIYEEHFLQKRLSRGMTKIGDGPDCATPLRRCAMVWGRASASLRRCGKRRTRSEMFRAITMRSGW